MIRQSQRGQEFVVVTVLAWGIAGAITAGFAAFVGTFVMDQIIPPPTRDVSLSAQQELVWIVSGAVIGLLVGMLGGSFLEKSNPIVGVLIWGLGGAATGAIGGWLIPISSAWTNGIAPIDLGLILAWMVAGLLAGIAWFCRNHWIANLPAVEDEAMPQGENSLRTVLVALGWGVAGAFVSGVVRAGMLRLIPHLGMPITPLGTDEPLTARIVLELIGWCALSGLGMGALGGTFLEAGRRIEGAVLWSLGGALTGAIGGSLTVALGAPGIIPSDFSTILAWAAAGLFVGVVGFWRSRYVRTDPNPEVEDAETEEVRIERPRVVWIRGTPAGRLLPVFAVAMGCFVFSLTTPPSSAGWAVVAIGLLGVAVGCALVGQERKIARLEERLRQVSKST